MQQYYGTVYPAACTSRPQRLQHRQSPGCTVWCYLVPVRIEVLLATTGVWEATYGGMGGMCSNVYSAPRYVLRMYLGKGTYVRSLYGGHFN